MIKPYTVVWTYHPLWYDNIYLNMTEQKWIKSNEEWSSQLWTQFMKLRKNLKKIQELNGIWTRDLAIPVRCSNQLSYEATGVAWELVNYVFICSRERDECDKCIWNKELQKWNQMKNDPRTGTYEHIIDELPTSVACTIHTRSTLDHKTSLFLLMLGPARLGHATLQI